MKVSVLVPVYGVEQYISQCAKSLFEQDYEDIEYIFVNDCTKDKSIQFLLDILEQYPNRKEQVKIINHLQNKGLAAARNTALENATGDYILPIDSDDFLSSNDAISKLAYKAMSTNADAVFYDIQSYPCNKAMPSLQIPLNNIILTRKVIMRETYLSIWGCLYKRNLFILNNIRSIESISMGEDYAIKPKLTYFMKIIEHIHEPFYCYRQNNTSSITNTFKEKHISDLKQCINEFNYFFKSKPDYNKYKEAIKIAEIRCKVQCLQWWGYANGSNKDFSTINSLFNNYRNSNSYLKKTEFLLYKLAAYNCPQLIKAIIAIRKLINK